MEHSGVIGRFSGERLRRAAKVCACVSLAILAAIAEWPRLGATRGRRPLILGQLLFALTLRNGFTVRHDPPVVELHFDSRCAWPRRPSGGLFEASP